MEKAQDINYLESSSKYNLKNEGVIEVPVGGEAFVYNSLAAISVGKALGIGMDKIKQGILKFELTKMRLDVQKSSKGYTIINDCYNANYDSMKSALQYLNRTPGNRKIAVLGDMLELGDFSKKLHEGVGNAVIENKVDILITVGKEAKNIAKIAIENNVETHEYTDNNSAISKLKEILEPEDAVLVKASNSMNFKEIVSAIM